ncbi:MAG: 30S ribosomal protein S7 [bacterium]|nr:30S ribosomal protein S7 [bacterium]
MSRGNKIVRRRVTPPDHIYNNKLLGKFINRIMNSGKKTVAEREVYSALEIIKEKGQEPISVFEKAITNVEPHLEVKSRRVGGASYQVPTEVRGERKVSLAMRWIIDAARKRPNREFHHFSGKLAAELLDAANNAGEAVKKRGIVHKMAEANKVFSHFRW